MFRNYWMPYFYLLFLLLLRSPGHSKLDYQEAKRNHLADLSARKSALKGTSSSQTSVMVQKNIFPTDNFEKLAKEDQKLTSAKKKTRLEIQILFV